MSHTGEVKVVNCDNINRSNTEEIHENDRNSTEHQPESKFERAVRVLSSMCDGLEDKIPKEICRNRGMYLSSTVAPYGPSENDLIPRLYLEKSARERLNEDRDAIYSIQISYAMNGKVTPEIYSAAQRPRVLSDMFVLLSSPLDFEKNAALTVLEIMSSNALVFCEFATNTGLMVDLLYELIDCHPMHYKMIFDALEILLRDHELVEQFRNIGGVPFITFILKKMLSAETKDEEIVHVINRIIFVLCSSSIRCRFALLRHDILKLQLDILNKTEDIYLLPTLSIIQIFIENGHANGVLKAYPYVKRLLRILSTINEEIFHYVIYETFEILLRHPEFADAVKANEDEFLESVINLTESNISVRLLVLYIEICKYEKIAEKAAAFASATLYLLHFLELEDRSVLGRAFTTVSRLMFNGPYAVEMIKLGLFEFAMPFLESTANDEVVAVLKCIVAMVPFKQFRNKIGRTDFVKLIWPNLYNDSPNIRAEAANGITAALKCTPKVYENIDSLTGWWHTVQSLVTTQDENEAKAGCYLVAQIALKKEFHIGLTANQIPEHIVKLILSKDNSVRDAAIIAISRIVLMPAARHALLNTKDSLKIFLKSFESPSEEVRVCTSIGFSALCQDKIFAFEYLKKFFIKYVIDNNKTDRKVRGPLLRSLVSLSEGRYVAPEEGDILTALEDNDVEQEAWDDQNI